MHKPIIFYWSTKMQQQLLLKREQEKSAQQENFLGLVSSLSDPFNLFLRLNELENPDVDLVYFFVYSLGRKKIMIWGTYSKSEEDFHIEAACRYKVSQLMKIQHHWQDNRFQYVANAALDRIRPTLQGTLDLPLTMSEEEYLKKKTFLAYKRGKITRAQLDDRLGPGYPEGLYDRIVLELIEKDKLDAEVTDPLKTKVFKDYLNRYLDDIESEIDEYEANRNLLTVEKYLGLPDSTVVELQKITQLFLRKMERSSVNSEDVYQWLPACPDRESCIPGSGGACGVYFYGTYLLSPSDLR